MTAPDPPTDLPPAGRAGTPVIGLPDTDWQAEQRREQVLAALGDVWDPELGLDVVALGLIYDVRVSGDRIEVDMTLTTPGCPVSEQLPVEAESAVRAALPGADVALRVVWDPPWTPERLSPLALEQLGFARRS